MGSNNFFQQTLQVATTPVATLPAYVGGQSLKSDPAEGITYYTGGGAGDFIQSQYDAISSHYMARSQFQGSPHSDQFGINGEAPAYYYDGVLNDLFFETAALNLQQNKNYFLYFGLIAPDASGASDPDRCLLNISGTTAANPRCRISTASNNRLKFEFRRNNGDTSFIEYTPANFYTPGESFLLTVEMNWIGNGTNATFSYWKNLTKVKDQELMSDFNASLVLSGPTENAASARFEYGGDIANSSYYKGFAGLWYLFVNSVMSAANITQHQTYMLAKAKITSVQIIRPENYCGLQADKTTDALNMVINLVYTGTAPVSFDVSFDGRPYVTPRNQTISGGTATLTLPAQARGTGSLRVRATDDFTRSCRRRNISVSDVIDLIGQSNNTDVLGNTLQTAKQFLTTDGKFPSIYNSIFGFSKWASINKHHMYLSQLAADYRKWHPYHCTFLLDSVGSRKNAQWIKTDSTYTYPGSTGVGAGDKNFIGSNLYTRDAGMILAATMGTGIAAASWLQHEADDSTATTASYTTDFVNHAASRAADYGVRTYPIRPQKIYTGTAGSPSYIDTSLITAAVDAMVISNTNTHYGGDLSAIIADYEAVNSGGYHMMSDSNEAAVAIQTGYGFGSGLGYAPIVELLRNATSFSLAIASIALRWVNSQYTGPLVRVRRASDSKYQDIYPKSETIDLDCDALLAFLNGSNGYVSTFYDQSGGGADLQSIILGSTSTGALTIGTTTVPLAAALTAGNPGLVTVPAPVAGDTVTFAGHSTIYTVGAGSTTSNIVLSSGLTAPVAAGEAVTVMTIKSQAQILCTASGTVSSSGAAAAGATSVTINSMLTPLLPGTLLTFSGHATTYVVGSGATTTNVPLYNANGLTASVAAGEAFTTRFKPYVQFNQSGNTYMMKAGGLAQFGGVPGLYGAFCGCEAQNTDTPTPGHRVIMSMSTTTSTQGMFQMTVNNSANSTTNPNEVGMVLRRIVETTSYSLFTPNTVYTNNVPFIYHCAANYSTKATTLYVGNVAAVTGTNTLTSGTGNNVAPACVTMGESLTQISDSKMRFFEFHLIGGNPTDLQRYLLARSQGAYWKAACA